MCYTAILLFNVILCVVQCYIMYYTDILLYSFAGKWFNYGIIFLVMILDLNMWKNQIFYAPEDFAQCVDEQSKISTLHFLHVLYFIVKELSSLGTYLYSHL